MGTRNIAPRLIPRHRGVLVVAYLRSTSTDREGVNHDSTPLLRTAIMGVLFCENLTGGRCAWSPYGSDTNGRAVGSGVKEIRSTSADGLEQR